MMVNAKRRRIVKLFDAGVDPYAIMLSETKRRGREALLTFRVNDAHCVPNEYSRFTGSDPV